MSSRKEIVEKALGVKVPAQYAAFLDKYGIYEAPGVEVYGIDDSLLGYDGIPCVIGATQVYRRDAGLSLSFLVIHNTGIEDEIICLDTENGKVYSISHELGNHKIADSFDEWFERDIIEFSKEVERRYEEYERFRRQKERLLLARERRDHRKWARFLARKRARSRARRK